MGLKKYVVAEMPSIAEVVVLGNSGVMGVSSTPLLIQYSRVVGGVRGCSRELVVPAAFSGVAVVDVDVFIEL